MNFEQEIRNQHNARKMNILKSFSDFSEDLLKKSLEGSELEKGHMDFSNQRTYADNSVNRKLNRVGQKYGGRNVEDENPGGAPKDKGEENVDKNKVPQETQPDTQGQYSTEQLTEFAAQAEDWQLQEFLDNAKKSGDNSEYMQAQVNIAETELNRRRGGESNSGEGDNFNYDEIYRELGGTSTDAINEISNRTGKPFEEVAQQLINEGKVSPEEVGFNESTDVDYSNSESVKNYLNSNPEAKQAVIDMMMEDISLSPAQALRLHQAETKSSGEAMKTVEAAKQALDELHAKLGGESKFNNNGIIDLEDLTPDEIRGMSNSELEQLFEDYTGGDAGDYSRSEMEKELIGRLEERNPNSENNKRPSKNSNDYSDEENFVNAKELKIGESYKYINPGFKDLNVEILNYPSEDTVSVKLLSDGEDGYKKGDVVDIQIEDISKGEGFIKTSDSDEENPSTSPAGEPNRAEQPTRENSDLEQEDSKDGILQEMDAEFSHLEGNWEKANPKTYDTSDMPNLMSYEGSEKMYDADLQLFYNPDNSTYIVENYANGNSEEFSSEEDVNNFINEALDNIGELNDNRNR